MNNPIHLLSDFYFAFAEYWYIFSRNSMPHLALFMLLLLLLFFMRHRREYNQIRNAVRQLPLVVGGWGTRGKSGTERKKCALFESVGLEVFSKTTGCEAMFLHSVPFSKAEECYLFRPYDKATIWEQGRVVEMAAKLNSQVMCWECMALNPEYVRILQQEWMRDRVATLTNTYPDHEDIQGPAGRDIPYVMNRFIPHGAVVFTAEEQMFPILAEEAARKKTALFRIDWQAPFYLTPDVLDRYPYKVHPENMALVLQMGEHLGIDRDFALKEMAEFIVPDLGVLKEYPEGRYLGRKLVFINGCSANERRGFLSNWVRMGFDNHTTEREPDVWLLTVVNNRADRIPRSKVFAEILVMDIAVHRNVLIGTNLTGMKGYIAESLSHRVRSITLPQTFSPEEPELDRTLRKILDDLKWESYSLEEAKRNIQIMLTGLGAAEARAREALAGFEGDRVAETFKPVLDEINVREAVFADFVQFGEMFVQRWRDFEALKKKVQEEYYRGGLDAAAWVVREAFHRGFMERLLVVEDAGVNGDEIVHFIAKRVPPGFNVKLMGTQNIKGTGLDFVYRWLALEKTVWAIESLQSPLEKRRQEALDYFMTNKEFGLLNTEISLAALARALTHDFYQTLDAQKQLKGLIEQIPRISRKIEKSDVDQQTSKARNFLFLALEAIFESEAGKRRVKTAYETYDLLCDGMISHNRAADILKELTKQQKGGWMAELFKNRKKPG